ncbi:Disease resistance protein RGA2 [Glycine soja]|uniref:Disease resistance protein RGA2 n=1 Tax=Glycine soja TaxID=3848 RepID=A0A445FEU3_GLYSO|nr:Disease resistance protein RGA2 [Glycine soja]
MVEAALNGVLGNLSSLAGTELGEFLGFNGYKRKHDSMVSEIKATLQDAEDKQFSDEATKHWLRKLKDAAYKPDDILDECAYEELGLEFEGVKCCLSEMLSHNDCWELFKHPTFGPNEEEQPELVAIGKEIVKCGGLPLAAITVGDLLRLKREERKWLYVKESNLWSLPPSENSIMPALRLSYLNLPMKLKQCFAYCAIFPKDDRIEKEHLIELWMANGFISSNEDVEDVGDGVRRELYWRSFFQDLESNEFDKVTSFKMHDLIHDLAQFVVEEILKLDYCESLQKLPNSLVRLKALQQLSLNKCFSLSSLPPQMGKLTSLRSLTMYIVDKERGFLLEELGPLRLKGYFHIKHWSE